MSHASGTSLSVRGAAAFAAALTLTGAAGVAQAQTRSDAQNNNPLAQGLYSDPREAGAKRYSTPDGQVRFVFDRTVGRVALVRFEGDSEVHVLRPVAGARGDEIYRTDSGDVILRVTPHGGIIVYTRTNRTGAPVAEEASVTPLVPPSVAMAAMRQRLMQLQAMSSRSIGQQVSFNAPMQVNGGPVNGIVLDAAERIAQGLSEAPMTTVRRVIITIGAAPAVALRGDTLIVQVAPQMGFAGRPSSSAIRNVVTGAVQGPEQ